MAVSAIAPPNPAVAISHWRRAGLSVTANDSAWQVQFFIVISSVSGTAWSIAHGFIFDTLPVVNSEKFGYESSGIPVQAWLAHPP
ncbi:hypothetical protein [Propionivibrio sp.]|uniref:hypothetical protein n=1 Tax=Propionivibrio sp. TaxID=2212460 RepID=UPI003BF3863A